MSDESCPRCGEGMAIQEWYEDHWKVEIKKECSCGYVYHWSYGSVICDGMPDDDLDME